MSLILFAPIVNAEAGSIGFSLAVSVDGVFSQKIERAEIKEVRANSPAALAGLHPGDLITRIEDCAIPGCPGSTANALMAKESGQLLTLTVQRDGLDRVVSIRLAPKTR